MKRYLYLMFVAALFVTSCAKEEQTENLVKAPSIVASQENNPITKTLLAVNEGVGTIYWQPAEDINVFFGTTSVKYTSTNTENVTTAAFETSTIIGSSEGSSTNIWGLYPYSNEAVCNGSKVTTTIPSTQYGVPETFDKNVFTTLAHSTTKELQFLNVCGGIKFSLSRADITKITFEGNNGETLAGNVDLTFVDNVPAATPVTAETKITLTPKTGSTFAKDVNYYIITLPVSMTGGFTMTFETATQIGTFNYSAKAVTVSRSKFSKKDSIDTYANFVDKPTPATDLSALGTANCYIVPAGGTYKFKSVQGNSTTSVGDVKGVKVLWETFGTDVTPTVGDLIKANVSYSDNYITFSTNDTYSRGNAVIAAYSDNDCSDGNVLWSWHIWLTGEEITSNDIALRNNAGTIMDRNLGAIYSNRATWNSFSFLYQYGRKDPFLGGTWKQVSSSYNMTPAVSTIDFNFVSADGYSYSIAHPTDFMTSWGDNNPEQIGWTSENKNQYDPCPVGYKVPNQYVYTMLAEAYQEGETPYRSVSTYGTDIYWYGSGYSDYHSIWFPYTQALYGDGTLQNIGLAASKAYADGALWTAGGSFYHSIYDGYISTNQSPNYTRGYAVRCCREDSPELTMPTTLSFNTETVTIPPLGSFDVTPIFSPQNTTFTKIKWTLPEGFSKTENPNGSYTITDTKGSIKSYTLYAKSPLAWSSSCPLATSILINVLPAEPTQYSYGGWYINAKSGDTFSFHLHVGTGDDGPNYYGIYLDNTKIADQGYSGSSSYNRDFSYTFTESFKGWLYIEVGWGFDVSNIITTATVLGRGNTWGTDVDLRMDDSWKNGTPSYKFRYENHVATIN